MIIFSFSPTLKIVYMLVLYDLIWHFFVWVLRLLFCLLLKFHFLFSLYLFIVCSFAVQCGVLLFSPVIVSRKDTDAILHKETHTPNERNMERATRPPSQITMILITRQINRTVERLQVACGLFAKLFLLLAIKKIVSLSVSLQIDSFPLESCK